MWTITTGNVAGVSAARVNSSIAVVEAAAEYWGRYLDFGTAVLDITVNIISLGETTLAQAGTSFTSIGANLFQTDTILELQTGIDQNGLEADIDIDINLDTIIANEFYFGLLTDPNPPGSQFDLFSILLHEIGHGLGFLSFFDQSETAVFDNFVSGPPSSPVFNGPLAMAAFGGSVPMEDDPSHVSQSVPISIMRPSFSMGVRVFLSEVDVRILQDIGMPVLGPTAGADILFGFPTSDTVFLSGGDDHYTALTGNDSISGEAGSDTLFGDRGHDTLIGGTEGDVIFGGADNDELRGDGGDDLLEGGSGADTLDGGSGFDTASYASSTSGVDIVLSTGAALGGHAVGDVLSGIEALVGSAFNDNLTGSAASNVLEGGAGADTLNGGAGIDTASYASATARVDVGLWNGLGVAGEAAGDVLSGIEAVVGSDFKDKLTGSGAADLLNGGGAGDRMFGSGGNDTLLGERGNDFLKGQGGDDTLNGGRGHDTLVGGTGFDTASYENANSGVHVEIWSGLGVIGEAFGDQLSDIEAVIGSNFNDKLTGNGSTNRLDGGGGHDRLWASAGNDTLDGGTGNDLLKGQGGDDVMNGGVGLDTLDGAAGDDTFQFDLGGGADRFVGFTAGAATDDKIELTGFGVAFDSYAEVIAAATQNGVDTVIDFGGGDIVTLENVALSTLHADDFLFG